MLLNKHNFAVADFVSKEQSRYTLQAIYVSDQGTCATDGHQLVRISLPAEKSKQFPSIEGVTPTNGHVKPFLLDVTAAKQIAKAVPKSKNLPILNHALVGRAYRAKRLHSCNGLGQPTSLSSAHSVWQLPKRGCSNPTKKPVFEIALNAALLGGIMKAATAFTPDEHNHEVLLRFYGKDEAVSVHCRNSETEQALLALLMPLRLSEPKHYGVTDAKQRVGKKEGSDEAQ